MEKQYYEEMIATLRSLDETGALLGCDIFVFGHCEASLMMIDELVNAGKKVVGILDNSKEKQGISYQGIPVLFPEKTIEYDPAHTIVLIATRFYEQMNEQLRRLGFTGRILKVVDYNSFSEYSLSEDTMARKLERVRQGEKILEELKGKFDGAYLVFCPFNAIGDVYFCMSYLPVFMRMREIDRAAVVVPSNSCSEVVRLFGIKDIAVLEQKSLDAAVQAAVYNSHENTFIAHQDRPYVVNLHKALGKKLIPLEDIYKIGIFGIKSDAEPVIPLGWEEYGTLDEIKEGQAAILSPYAKSVTALRPEVWKDIVDDLLGRDLQVFTNVFGDEKPLPGTLPISPTIRQMKSVVERAGIFIGIRSGLCDILRTAKCRKIALFPDYNYGDTKWKAIDMYALDGFENIVVGDDYKWLMN
jgi:hypothetical protein